MSAEKGRGLSARAPKNYRTSQEALYRRMREIQLRALDCRLAQPVGWPGMQPDQSTKVASKEGEQETVATFHRKTPRRWVWAPRGWENRTKVREEGRAPAWETARAQCIAERRPKLKDPVQMTLCKTTRDLGSGEPHTVTLCHTAPHTAGCCLVLPPTELPLAPAELSPACHPC